jgi:ABC-type thiamin/hydroxymethylpyrimidine transport system permease subunit
MPKTRYYFSTRELLLMAALAALGGVTSTYVNAVGDLIHSVIGIPGASQWAAGLHVLWLVLAVGLVKKPGTGTVTGILKGLVELLTGNTHGLLVVMVDIVAGVLIDLGLLPFKQRNNPLPYAFAGGLASASNIFVFQLFAAMPASVLSFSAILLVAVVAFLSGVIFAGVLGFILLNTLRRTGVVKDQQPLAVNRRVPLVFLGVGVLMAGVLGVYLKSALRGPDAVQVGGAVSTPYKFPEEHGDIPLITSEATLQGATAEYRGYPLLDVISRASPTEDAELLLIRATDGYAFFLSMDELRNNPSLLLSPQGKGDEASYHVVGPENSKAWVRGVAELIVFGSASLEITGALEDPRPYQPAEWQFEMDSTRLDVGLGPNKYQGASFGEVLKSMNPAGDAVTVILYGEGEEISLGLDEILADDEIRIFTIIDQDEISFAVARMDGEVISAQVSRIEVR